jgi:hypothetical protein
MLFLVVGPTHWEIGMTLYAMIAAKPTILFSYIPVCSIV